MNQDELNRLYKVECKEDSRKYDKKLNSLGAIQIGEFDHDPDADVGGTYGIEELLKSISQHGYIVLDDPIWGDRSGNLGWVVFPPCEKE